ncbi:hypothetical protein K431DRAFT_256312 [Polychaeton citri CBS 116435]|uniref:Zn(2)-C6 fungal-type domain-containing protein n=1 Tax=Polychaeton citri CBS 116435 TaxID=1314669 RepID=A0A9P4Q280_9PEZI|nr:hypothetical protein K431DRAFT_256312 [Polychaeton citri CBS 116435]
MAGKKTGSSRQRTFTGCKTCRRRRVKCGEERPACNQCRRLELHCEGYDALLQWMKPYGPNEISLLDNADFPPREDVTQSRRPLYSNAERQRMCDELLRSVQGPSDADDRFDLEDSSGDLEQGTILGPYGVFSVRVAATKACTHPEPQTVLGPQLNPGRDAVNDPVDAHRDASIDYQDCLQENSGATIEVSNQQQTDPNCIVHIFDTTSFDMAFQQSQDFFSSSFDMIPELQIDDFAAPTSCKQIDNTPDNHSCLPGSTSPSEDWSWLYSNRDRIFEVISQGSSTEVPADLPFVSASLREPSSDYPHMFSSLCLLNDNASEARHLLEHFRSVFIHVGPHNVGSKAPWRILQLPIVHTTLGQIALGDQPGDVSLSILSSVMAISALHLDRHGASCGKSGVWWHIGEKYKNEAIFRLQKSLSVMSDIIRPNEYKSLLMALLTMVSVCLTSGRVEQSRSFLIDAQNLIKKFASRRNNRKPRSHKIQLLHAMFIYLRVMEEATFVYPLSATHASVMKRVRLEKALKYPSLAIDIQPTPSAYLNLDTILKEDDEAIKMLLADHFGISQSLISLISRVTLLACEARQGKAQYGALRIISDLDFDKHVKELEDLLCDWQYDGATSMPNTGQQHSSSPPSFAPKESMARAFHSALLLYFYREVKDVNRRILQHLVKDIMACLAKCESSKAQESNVTSVVAWPAFVAGVEAEDDSDFEQILAWMRACADTYGLRSFDRAACAVTEIRTQRKQQGSNARWPDVMLQNKVFLLLS